MPAITDLPDLVAALPPGRRARFERIFDVQRDEGRCVVPESMRGWVEQHFGAVEAVETQHIIRVTNRVTWEGVLFNPLRLRRPMRSRPAAPPAPPGSLPPDDIFAEPERTTSADVFGRARGAHCVTASNVARWDGWCAVLIFDEPDPLAATPERMRDYFRTSLEWAARARQADPEARYLAWMWNGGLAGGATVPHAHAQLGLGRGRPYARVEALRRAAADYRARHGADFFADLLGAHADVGLAFRAGELDGFVNLAPFKAKETWVLGRALDDRLADAFAITLRALIDRTGMQAFDAAVLLPPLFDPPVDGWADFPAVVRIIDRGRPDALSSDVGALDLFIHSVVAHDPFAVRQALAL